MKRILLLTLVSILLLSLFGCSGEGEMTPTERRAGTEVESIGTPDSGSSDHHTQNAVDPQSTDAADAISQVRTEKEPDFAPPHGPVSREELIGTWEWLQQGYGEVLEVCYFTLCADGSAEIKRFYAGCDSEEGTYGNSTSTWTGTWSYENEHLDLNCEATKDRVYPEQFRFEYTSVQVLSGDSLFITSERGDGAGYIGCLLHKISPDKTTICWGPLTEEENRFVGEWALCDEGFMIAEFRSDGTYSIEYPEIVLEQTQNRCYHGEWVVSNGCLFISEIEDINLAGGLIEWKDADSFVFSGFSSRPFYRIEQTMATDPNRPDVTWEDLVGTWEWRYGADGEVSMQLVLDTDGAARWERIDADADDTGFGRTSGFGSWSYKEGKLNLLGKQYTKRQDGWKYRYEELPDLNWELPNVMALAGDELFLAYESGACGFILRRLDGESTARQLTEAERRIVGEWKPEVSDDVIVFSEDGMFTYERESEKYDWAIVNGNLLMTSVSDNPDVWMAIGYTSIDENTIDVNGTILHRVP